MLSSFRIFVAVVAAALAAVACAGFCSRSERRVYAEEISAASPTQLVEYDGRVEHIFTHELIFDTAKAFAKDNSVRDCFDKDHLTAREFSALLGELYKNDYVLVGMDKTLSGAPLMLPRGKKPLVISFDDMNYDTHDRGCIDKLVVVDGKIYDYTATAEPKLSRERDNVTVLESFIEKHPDFAPDGARATLCVNGYNGILGHRCTPSCNVSTETAAKETAACEQTVAALRALGYTFASHTYYHKYFNSCSASMLEKDCAEWRKCVEPIVGKTRMLCYPAGEHKADSPKNDVFKRYGFDVFLCVGNFAGTKSERESADSKYIYRLPFDGTALRLYEKQYAHLADTRAIYDGSRFRSFSYRGGYHK